ncbi:PF20097 family protein [Pygmaiobacter massiliensis]|uniref:PF20097 family protein n=1 Tax=Pygmaiobacter massiliensis TaxID=1917873 RepID=UPI000C7A8AC1|nr:PF20097 family protein [Pygmaiobacter massiliensis]
MQCPYCHGKMQKGIIDSRGRVLRWFSDEQLERGFLEAFKGKKLCGMTSELKAYYCPDCEKMIIDTTDTEPD